MIKGCEKLKFEEADDISASRKWRVVEVGVSGLDEIGIRRLFLGDIRGLSAGGDMT